MHVSRKIVSRLGGRVRRGIAISIFTASIAASAFVVAPAASATPTSAKVAPAAVAPAASVCANQPIAPTGFWRCTPTAWVVIGCNPDNHNAGTGDVFNVIYSDNYCNYRVWLHQYTSPNDGTGWAYCITPVTGISDYEPTPPQYAHPENIEIVNNTSACTSLATLR